MDQTGFTQNQESLQAPPPPEFTPEQQQLLLQKQKKQKRLMMIAGGVLGTMLLLMVLLSVFAPKPRQITTPDINFPNSNQASTSPFTQRFLDLKDQLTKFDPTDIELAPPPIDYQLKFQSQQ